MNIAVRALFIAFAISNLIVAAHAQDECGQEYLRHELFNKNPESYNLLLKQINAYPLVSNLKRKHEIVESPIPVIFHVLLNEQQFESLGETIGLRNFINSAMNVINKDFNGENADSSLIPTAFKSQMSSIGIRFALARVSPNGNSCSGYEIKIIDSPGYSAAGQYGSGIAFSDCKYSAIGGLDIWDPSSYLNVWIVNTLGTNILAITISPLVASIYQPTLQNEIGVVMHYKILGLRDTSQPHIYGREKGRVLTHELGHFFEISHTWGDDNGLCPDNGGVDDGIEDTPPESNAIFGCPIFPVFDQCSSSFPGIMFMNFMDYSDDNCRYMFTKKQGEKMLSCIQPFGESFSLVSHPELIDSSNNKSDVSIYRIFPNPSHAEEIKILFSRVPTELRYIKIYNALGQVVYYLDTKNQAKGFYKVIFHAPGIYTVECGLTQPSFQKVIIF
ncbi:MAG: zinc-dependent metalloprotease [Bacteroidetes bacterium]|nr:zinc-dependent metalloprotease [Bacteroidota bacterium]